MEFDDAIFARASRLSVAEQMRAYREDVCNGTAYALAGRLGPLTRLRSTLVAGAAGRIWARWRASGLPKSRRCPRPLTWRATTSRRTSRTWTRSVKTWRTCGAPVAPSSWPSGAGFLARAPRRRPHRIFRAHQRRPVRRPAHPHLRPLRRTARARPDRQVRRPPVGTSRRSRPPGRPRTGGRGRSRDRRCPACHGSGHTAVATPSKPPAKDASAGGARTARPFRTPGGRDGARFAQTLIGRPQGPCEQSAPSVAASGGSTAGPENLDGGAGPAKGKRQVLRIERQVGFLHWSAHQQKKLRGVPRLSRKNEGLT